MLIILPDKKSLYTNKSMGVFQKTSEFRYLILKYFLKHNFQQNTHTIIHQIIEFIRKERQQLKNNHKMFKLVLKNSSRNSSFPSKIFLEFFSRNNFRGFHEQ